ncbi:hypothetical protein DVA86_07025 [Streptomyces armeniacus]|uniref:Rod shape-determining protein MreB n=1 Tax=Streptomyces armeniacus TaxID=83291 RepID=A0A345XLC6_9ACTN|nr:hypothetical protein DVA86_07025 [Streptomyces armeniacus]
MTAVVPLPGRRGAGRAAGARRPGLALDLGSARTRAWSTVRGAVLDVPTVTFPGTGASYPVQRGAIVDTDGTARMLDRLLGHRLPRRGRPLIVLTTPVLGGPAYRTAALAALEVLRPRGVLTVPAMKAAALGAHADLSRPLLVADIGAHLTEICLLTDGAVSDAYATALGTGDLGDAATPYELSRAVTRMVTDMVRADRTGQSLDALQHGVLLVGGGALRPDVVHCLSRQLRTPVTPAPAPHTAALRGAAALLRSARGHGTGLAVPM